MIFTQDNEKIPICLENFEKFLGSDGTTITSPGSTRIRIRHVPLPPLLSLSMSEICETYDCTLKNVPYGHGSLFLNSPPRFVLTRFNAKDFLTSNAQRRIQS